MGLIVNGTPPTAIKVIKDGSTTDLRKLQTRDAQALIEARWGKPYILTIDAGEHSTITVTRTESLYQNAPLETLQDGSLIYNGDQIRINVSVDSGYQLTKLLYCTQVIILGEESWNEVEISDGYTTSSAMTSIDGTFSTNVKIISTVEQSASWRTIFTGQKNVLSSSTDANSYTISTLDIDKVVSNGDIKVTGFVHYYASGVTETTENFTDVEVKNDGTTILVSDIANISTSSNLIQVRAKSTKFLTSVKQTQVSITEVKQYY